jgi:protein-tyrosine-phosphatase
MKILFICKWNVGRSQIAEFFFNKFSKKHNSISAGTNPKSEGINGKKLSEISKLTKSAESTVLLMRNIDPGFHNKLSKQLTPERVKWADRIIVMTEKENLPDYMDYSKVTFWSDIPDGKDKSYDFICGMRDMVKQRVKELIKEIEK